MVDLVVEYIQLLRAKHASCLIISNAKNVYCSASRAGLLSLFRAKVFLVATTDERSPPATTSRSWTFPIAKQIPRQEQ